MKLEKILSSINLTSELDDEELVKIGNTVVDGYLRDINSRKAWEQDVDKWTELALQISKQKTFPWNGASNVKYPLLATASMQFAARAYPSLVPSDGKLVKGLAIHRDRPEDSARAERVGKHMSYQLIHEMDNWERDMDRLLLILPIIGTTFKKTYFDSSTKTNRSILVLPKNLVVDYWTTDLDKAERITEWFEKSKRLIKEKQREGIYRDVDLPDPQLESSNTDTKTSTHLPPEADETTPYTILEQHTYLDLDKDGYAEPYIVLVESQSRTVLRIVPNFSQEDVTQDEKGKIVRIIKKNYYTKFGFIPNPDGGFYDIGFGRLLGTINSSADTIINQLIDAGTLSNLQAGFIGKGLRIKMGDTRFTPGEWKAVNATGDDLKKQILPLPTNQPSEVLFKLLDYLIKSGKELASVADIFVGKMPGQNTPATTTMASIEQGMKVFTAVYKRIFRSLTEEFRKLYRLNAEYLDPETYIEFIGEEVKQSDYFASEKSIFPAADPAATSQQEKQQRAQVLLQTLGLGTLDPIKVTETVLIAHEVPDYQSYIKEPSPPPPDPKMEAMKLKAELDMQKAQAQIQIDQIKAQMEIAGEQEKKQLEIKAQAMKLHMDMISSIMEARASQAKHAQTLQQTEDKHLQKLNMETQGE